MRRSDSIEMEQSYLLPSSAVANSVVLRSSLQSSSSLHQKSNVPHLKRVEVVSEALEARNPALHWESLCQLCANEVNNSIGHQIGELQMEVKRYEHFFLNQSTEERSNRSLDKLQSEIESVVTAISTFDDGGLSKATNMTSLRNEKILNCIELERTRKETCILDYDLNKLDNDILTMLELLDSTAKEINCLKDLGSTTHINPSSTRNVVGPLFDAIDYSEGSKTTISINASRLCYTPSSSMNLNNTEINSAYVNLCVLLNCLRNMYDLPSISTVGVTTGRRSPYFNKGYRIHFQSQMNQKVYNGDELSLCENRLCRLVNMTENSQSTQFESQMLQLRPLQGKVLIRLLEPTGVSSATEEWLHLESGVSQAKRQLTYSFKTSSKRNLNKVDWQSGSSGGSCAKNSTVIHSPIPTPSSNFFSNILANSIFHSPVSSPPPTSSTVRSPGGDLDETNEDEAIVVESEHDDPEYRRAVIALACVVVITSLDVLMVKSGTSPVKLTSIGVSESYKQLWSLIVTHLTGCMKDVACAMMTGCSVGFEESLQSHDLTEEYHDDFEVVNEHEDVDYMQQSIVTNKNNERILSEDKKKEKCRVESLFDVKHTRLVDMQQLVLDMALTVKHITSLS